MIYKHGLKHIVSFQVPHKYSYSLQNDAAYYYAADLELFARNGIEVEWQGFEHPIYPQQHGDFVPFLSALDLVLNCGPDSAAILSGQRTKEDR